MLEQSAYDALVAELLPEHRKRHPQARLAELLRHLLDQAIRQHRRTDPARRGAAEREHRERQREMRRLAVAAAAAPDDKLEATAARLAAILKRD
jgi:hypothetical protein